MTRINPVNTSYLLIGALLLALAGSYLLFRPYVEAIILAFLAALVCNPFNCMLRQRMGERSALASLVTCLLVTLLVVIPVVLALVALLRQGAGYAGVVIQWVDAGGVTELMQRPTVLKILETINTVVPAEITSPDYIKDQVMGTASQLGVGLFSMTRQIVGGAAGLMLSGGLMMIVLFFMLRDYDAMVEFLRRAVPLSRSQEDRLLDETVAVTRSALLGNLITAALQGTVAGFGMWMAGFPGFFWGAMIALASFIPVVGTALIWIPAALYLWATGEAGWALFLTLWSAILVGSIDNFVRPMFVQGAAALNGLLIFLSILGGLQLFGLMGLIYGPLIISLTLVLYRMYEQEFSDFLERQDQR